jgi:hypothetical protein
MSRATLVFLGLWAAPGQPAAAEVAGVISRDDYENLDAGREGRNVPLTFSRVGAAGDFTRGVTAVVEGTKVPSQVDVLRKAPDGSIRHALVSLVLPGLPAGGKLRIDWLNEPPPEPAPFRWGFDPAGFSAKLLLTTESGKVLSSDAGAILAGQWTGSINGRTSASSIICRTSKLHALFSIAAWRWSSCLAHPS